jgi:hypothetical protein
MLWVYSDLLEARRLFAMEHPTHTLLDWSDATPAELVEQAETVLRHHSQVAVFLG